MSAIADHKSSTDYKLALEGEAYDKQQNTTIMKYKKLLYTMSGEAIQDMFTANHKLPSNFYNRFNVQENQYLLGNGVNFNNDDTKERLGTKKYAFDTQMQKLGKRALTQGVAFGFFNLDHLQIFELLEFVPLLDEEDGSLKAGIRFWQLDSNKPLRATLYEMDGYTEYIRSKNSSELEIRSEKKPYVVKVKSSEVDGEEIYDGENYPAFPIIPLWGNQDHVCKIAGWRYKIDCYDLIESGFANDVDDASLIYWTLENAGGMDDVDLAKFIQHMRTVRAAATDDAVKAEAHTIDVPVTARETYLNRLEKDLIKDAMALDTDAIASGSATATAIRASYEPLNNKTDDFEYCVTEFIQNILELAGIDDEPSFKRSTIVNQSEETTMVLQAAEYLDDETILKHLPFISTDEVDAILQAKDAEEMDRYELEDDMSEVNNAMAEYGDEVAQMLEDMLKELDNE